MTQFTSRLRLPVTLCAAALLAACADQTVTAAESAPAETSAETHAEVAAAPASPLALPRSFDYMAEGGLLIFSATSDWRHDSGIAGASAFWSRLSDENGYGLYITEDARIFDDERLSKFGTIIMNSATGNVLSASQQAAIEAFVEGGGGLIAQHAMGDSSLAKNWPWWEAQLGTEFISHPSSPQFQKADVVILADGHPVVDGLGAKFEMTDEWYTFTKVPVGDVVILAGLDESTYSPTNPDYGPADLSMGPEPEDHPIIWATCPGEGRIVYSALGHKADAYDNEAHRRLLQNALAWVGSDGPGCPE